MLSVKSPPQKNCTLGKGSLFFLFFSEDVLLPSEAYSSLFKPPFSFCPHFLYPFFPHHPHHHHPTLVLFGLSIWVLCSQISLITFCLFFFFSNSKKMFSKKKRLSVFGLSFALRLICVLAHFQLLFSLHTLLMLCDNYTLAFTTWHSSGPAARSHSPRHWHPTRHAIRPVFPQLPRRHCGDPVLHVAVFCLDVLVSRSRAVPFTLARAQPSEVSMRPSRGHPVQRRITYVAHRYTPT